jgi:hypothetical protein
VKPQWRSQMVPAMGAIKAEGIKNQLGRPTLDRFVVLTREAAQNSWDAADHEQEGPVRFSMDLRNPDEPSVSAWRALLSENVPDANELPLRTCLASPLTVLFVADRGTRGLGGPTRADAALEKPHDYVSFVLNVGDPPDTPHGGGTYGFGKAVFYLASTASTVLIHTRCLNEHGVAESRLVGCALGPSFTRDGRLYTGRHWFGLPVDSSDLVEPIRGDEADAIAHELGFPPFESAERGTTVAVIAPDLQDSDAATIAERLAHSILWHLWPKMVDRGTGPAMRFSVTHDGIPAEVADPTEHPVIREFTAALLELDETGETIPYGAGAAPVGRIRLRTIFAPPPVVDDVGQEAGFRAGVHHCCLMRSPELVVEYREGPAMPDERIWYAGVFKVLPDMDTTFGHAEPPTHDGWSPEHLDGHDKSIVRTTLRKIGDALRNHVAPRTGATPGGSAEGLAGMSSMLGNLLAPAPGEGAGPVEPGPGRGGRPSSVQMLGAPEWTRFDGRDVLAQSFQVNARRLLTVEAETTVRVWGGGGKETEPPAGARQPQLLAWRDSQGGVHPPGRLAIGVAESGRWEAIVASPPDTVTRIRVREAVASVDLDG